MAIQKAQIQSSKIIQNPKLHTLQSLKVIRLEHRTSSALPRIDCSLHLANAWHKSVGPLARLHHRNRSVFEPGHQDAAVSQEFDPWHSHLDLLRSCVAERTVAGERHLGTYNIVIALNCKKQTTTSLTTQHVANSNTLEDQHTLPSRSLLLVCNNMQQLFFKMPVYNAMQNPGKPLLQHLCLVLIFVATLILVITCLLCSACHFQHVCTTFIAFSLLFLQTLMTSICTAKVSSSTLSNISAFRKSATLAADMVTLSFNCRERESRRGRLRSYDAKLEMLKRLW